MRKRKVFRKLKFEKIGNVHEGNYALNKVNELTISSSNNGRFGNGFRLDFAALYTGPGSMLDNCRSEINEK
jgi:hypothetical protein